MTFSADGRYLATLSEQGIFLWRCYASQPPQKWRQVTDHPNIRGLKFVPNVPRLAMHDGNEVMIYDFAADTPQEVMRIQHFGDAGIIYRDGSYQAPLAMTDSAWKYLNNRVTDANGNVSLLSPDTHPDWQKLVQLANRL